MSKYEQQKIIKISARGVATHEKGETGTLCVAFPETCEAWELDYNQQSQDAQTGELVQIVSTLNKKPLKVFDNRPDISGQSIQSIGAQEFDAAIMQIEQDNQKKSMLLWLGILMLTLAVIIGLVVLVSMYKG